MTLVISDHTNNSLSNCHQNRASKIQVEGDIWTWSLGQEFTIASMQSFTELDNLETNISWNKNQLRCIYNNLHWTALIVNFAAWSGPATKALCQTGVMIRSLLLEKGKGRKRKKKKTEGQQGILSCGFFSLDTFLKTTRKIFKYFKTSSKQQIYAFSFHSWVIWILLPD